MVMEKTGDISENTPQRCGSEKCGCDNQGQPMNKEAADQLESSPLNSAIDAVAEQTTANKNQ